MKKLTSLFFVFFILFFSSFANADECNYTHQIDFYTGNSVKLLFGVDALEYEQGAPINFCFSVRNFNGFPQTLTYLVLNKVRFQIWQNGSPIWKNVDPETTLVHYDTLSFLESMILGQETFNGTGSLAPGQYQLMGQTTALSDDTLWLDITITPGSINNPPLVINPINDTTLVAGITPQSAYINLATVFTDPDGDSLDYQTTVISGIIEVSIVNDSILAIVYGPTSGLRDVIVYAFDPGGMFTVDIFQVTVMPPPPTGSHVLFLPDTTATEGELLSVPVTVSTDSAIGFAQFVVEFDSTVVEFTNALVGSGASGFSLVVNDNPPFPPTAPGTNKNALVQIYSGSSWFSGQQQEVVVLEYQVVGLVSDVSPLVFDHDLSHTMITTINNSTLTDSDLTFQNGQVVIIQSLFNTSGLVEYLSSLQPISGTNVNLNHINGTSDTLTDANGQYVFSAIEVGQVTLIASKANERAGIDGADGLKLLRTLAFLDTLSSDEQLAADVTEDGILNGSDAIAILRFLAFFTTGTANTGEWRFVPSDTGFVLSSNAYVDFVGYLLGDVNLSWISGSMMAKAGGTTESTTTFLSLPDTLGQPGDTLELSLKLTTDSLVGFVQAVVEFDSTVVEFTNALVGSGASGFRLAVNDNPPFPPTAPGTNKNALVQIYSGTDSITGYQQKVVVLRMVVVGQPGTNSSLVFDSDPAHTMVTTVGGTTLTAPDLLFENGSIVVLQITGVNDESVTPTRFELTQNYPNPFNPTTTITYSLPNPSEVKLIIYNALGQRVRTLVSGQVDAGRHQVIWNSRDNTRALVASGVYIYRLDAGEFVQTHKMVLMK